MGRKMYIRLNIVFLIIVGIDQTESCGVKRENNICLY